MKNTINNISKKYYKENKGRNRLIIIAIILSTCLFTSICIFVSSINHTIKMDKYSMVGGQHMILFDLNKEKQEKVELFQKTDKIGMLKSIGMAESEKLEKSKVNVNVVYMDESVLWFNGMDLDKGSLPKEVYEIAAESRVLKNLGGDGVIGENIKISYSTQEGTVTNEFKVVGILSENRYKRENRVGEVILSKAFVDSLGIDEYVVFVKMKGLGSAVITENCFSLQSLLELDDEKARINFDVINSISIDPSTVLGGGMIGLIVILAVTVVIYNVFYISVRERVNILGLLSAVGTTNKQIKKIIKNEGRRAALIGIPLGIGVGYLLSYIIIPLTMSNINMKIYSNPIIIPIVALTAYITVALGMRKPIKIASKVSPIEAVKYTGVEDIGRKKKRKSYRQVDVKALAKENFVRNKRRTVMTIASLSLSGILFITASTILSSMNVENITYGDFVGEHKILLNRDDMYESEINPIDEEFIKKIKGIDGVKDLMLYKYRPGSRTDISILERESNFPLYGYDDSTLDKLEEYVIEGELDREKLRNGNGIILFNRKNVYSLGEEIERREVDDEGREYINKYEVIAIVNYLPARVGWWSSGIHGITHADNMPRKINDKYIGMEVDTLKGNTEIVGLEMERICKDNSSLEFGGMIRKKKELEKELVGMKSIVYSLVAIIGIIGMLNMINTMVTSILSRQKEFGLLQAIGLSNKELNRMIQLEGIYYATISGIISVLGGSIIGKYAFNAFSTEATYAIYKYPVGAVIATVGIFFLLQSLVIFFVKDSMGKDSIVERIRYNA